MTAPKKGMFKLRLLLPRPRSLHFSRVWVSQSCPKPPASHKREISRQLPRNELIQQLTLTESRIAGGDEDGVDGVTLPVGEIIAPVDTGRSTVDRQCGAGKSGSVRACGSTTCHTVTIMRPAPGAGKVGATSTTRKVLYPPRAGT